MKDQLTDATFPIKNESFSTLAAIKSLPGIRSSLYSGVNRNFGLELLFDTICKKLQPLFSIDCGALTIYGEELSMITANYIATDAGSVQTIKKPVALSAVQLEIAGYQYPVLKTDEDWIDEMGGNHQVHEGQNYRFHCYIPLEIGNTILGTLELHNVESNLSAEGLKFCCTIADLLAELVHTLNCSPDQIAVDGDVQKVFLPHAGNQDTLTGDYYSLLKLADRISAIKNWESFNRILDANFKDFSFLEHYAMIQWSNESYPGNAIICASAGLIENQPAFSAYWHSAAPGENEILDLILSSTLPVTVHIKDLLKKEFAPDITIGPDNQHIKKMVGIALRNADQVIGILFVYGAENFFFAKEQMLLKAVASQVSAALSNLIALDCIQCQAAEIDLLRKQVDGQQLYEQKELAQTNHYEELVGGSTAMQEVFSRLNRVADTETTVLILGETGTGKELIARAIHHNSPRKDNSMIKVNCAAIPPNLIESELFGHERGSFTGATERRIGKFELANNSTLFLDEIGELSLELQVKLLRVLQEKEIERVGGKTTIKTDVRIISATNRNLQDEVAGGRFRQDLYYRLNVFPVILPSLRERKDDIPLLANHFLNRFATKSGHKIEGFSQSALAGMMKYHWPGNVRELEHLIERQVLLTNGPLIRELEIPSAEKAIMPESTVFAPVKTIAENERDHIFSVLKLCNGKISGRYGAAKLLGVPATTLNSKIKKLGLSKKHIV